MAGKVKPIPEGYAPVTPYLVVDGAAAAIDFYTKFFGAKERMRMPAPDNKIGHAEIGLVLYVENVDDTVKRATTAGAKVVRPVEDQFYGDRMGTILDPFGHQWYVATHIEDVSPEEMKRRMAAMAPAGA